MCRTVFNNDAGGDMTANMNRLANAGFKPAGSWRLAERGLELVLAEAMARQSNVLYAFVVDGALVYVGKTTQVLGKRMQGYKTPPASGEKGGLTNIKNNRNIVAALIEGHVVDIFVLCAPPEQRHGEFVVNLSARLEDRLIKALSPAWNGRPQKFAESAPVQVRHAAPTASFSQHSSTMHLPRSAGIPANPPSDGVHMTPTAETLIALALGLQGEALLTLSRKSPFRVEVVGNLLEFTPGSSRVPRRESRESVATILAQLAKTASFQMSDYSEVSFNASYVLALVKRWQKTDRELRSTWNRMRPANRIVWPPVLGALNPSLVRC
jgi:hypothetical protein